MTGLPAGQRMEPLFEARERFVAYVARRVDDHALAEDIVQDGMLKALRALPALRDEERLVPWFLRILRHAIVDEYRRRAVAARHTEMTEDFPEVADPGDDDEKAVCACFRALLPAVRAEYAELIESLDLEGEEPQAVAERLGITLNNLKVRRHRARHALKKQLEAACGICANGRCIGDCTC